MTLSPPPLGTGISRGAPLPSQIGFKPIHIGCRRRCPICPGTSMAGSPRNEAAIARASLSSTTTGNAEPAKSNFGPVDPLLRERNPWLAARAVVFASIGPSVILGLCL
ncbi:hypothetical protein N7492_000734 [Penicillium capsulatum]|uniref:Uncharacterized protein n=1 Tax=Penicillium capsulatum TaxID=69766 RepID=A0A9W9IQ46_9EURO|nr:hypothetical protein N7492_000734 [Penicillium capsulatum]KAJ6130207.1 hypothetical protein N7512_002987 [Penicillium capsulatum]